MTTECIITGVVLIDSLEDVAYNGDLFQQGDTYIVNCNEQSAHTPDEDWRKNHDLKWITPPVLDSCWSRRGVYVFPAREAVMSRAAMEYVRPHLEAKAIRRYE